MGHAYAETSWAYYDKLGRPKSPFIRRGGPLRSNLLPLPSDSREFAPASKPPSQSSNT
ncbi:hypothetical protein CCACVL1_02643 [Corchorus capsularis]|uniref:Uncharacterized protein n=1 Tax=Corchorus capsularis TaxID=210143 RepID=A0A1R3K7F0_COCAP|nr:hypothetical protein CCACVL1_02643 [Corchorus capsularis]